MFIFVIFFVAILMFAGQGLILWMQSHWAQTGQSRFSGRGHQAQRGVLEDGRQRVRAANTFWTAGASSSYSVEVDSHTPVQVWVEHIGVP